MILDTYTTTEEQKKPENKDKKVISDDAFAICQAIERLALSLRGSHG